MNSVFRWMLIGTALCLQTTAACDCGGGPEVTSPMLGDGFVGVESVGSTQIRLTLQSDVDTSRLGEGKFTVANFQVVPPEDIEVQGVTLTSARVVDLQVASMVPGRTYTLVVTALPLLDGRSLAGTLNFVAAGSLDAVTVRVTIDDVEVARAHDALTLLATVSPETGAFAERVEIFPLVDEGSAFAASLLVQMDPNRTVDPSDDGDSTTDRRAYAMRVVDGAGRPVSAMYRFALLDDDSLRELSIEISSPPDIVLPEPSAPLLPPPEDPNPGDGIKLVRVLLDDRAAQELIEPALRVSFDEDGVFDSSFPRTLPFSQVEGEDAGYYEALVAIQVDPNRVEDGQTEETFPYFAYLVSDEVAYEAISVALIAPDETPESIRLVLGNPNWTPVTFRVDVSGAYVTPDGSVRGHYPNEAIFLTGAWQSAVDALGNNCGDSFSGGESLNLMMREHPDFPGVWTRTLWLPPGRPYGWKVVRCDAASGCGPLNQLVSSSGRAFATVMKNLATDNIDTFADPSVGLIDPIDPTDTPAQGNVFDYSDATVYVGNGSGSEPDPEGTPDGQRMFKQEVPDLVVVVGDQPVKTRIFHVGTWRDVNLTESPQDIVDNVSVVDLNPLDYDDFFTGRYPPSREDP